MVSRGCRGAGYRGWRVLNAFRRHGWFHCQPPCKIGPRLRVCSTPFGVMDGFTRQKSPSMTEFPCAQRLSASWMVSLMGARANTRRHGVLNAFRRHGWFHLTPAPHQTRSTGAQRLSASWMVSHASRFLAILDECVLNAFRRHGWFHDTRRDRDLLLRVVLNAFRRHGWFHGLESFYNLWGGAVLNAFRRHGWFHYPWFGGKSAVVECSTPFGVMDGFTTTRLAPPQVLRSAQRLSASWMVSLVPTVADELGFRLVLNAFRRHGWFHFVLGDCLPDVELVLNAFRRHGWFHRAVGLRYGSGRRVLNAFRRHGWFHNRHGKIHRKEAVCAQRLSASWMVSPDCCQWRRQARSRAQRLSASWMVSQMRPVEPCDRVHVLNAFRRHGWFHDGGGVDREFIGIVLNAFRRHGWFHWPSCRSLVRSRAVLNAFRRHGWFHDEDGPERVSTSDGAQRLSASWMVSLSDTPGPRDPLGSRSPPFG